jgi:aspartate carbamoyltransferase catalytic subunit
MRFPKHILSSRQFLDVKLLESIFQEARELEQMSKNGSLPPLFQGKLLASVFYEPSTRTRFSFESAMLRLGGQVITAESASANSSATKGETLEDSIKIISGYADLIVLRHPETGAAKRASLASEVPVINAGDGAGEHPTQSILDAYTIQNELGEINGLKIGFLGDLKNGHSLLQLLSAYPGVTLTFIAPKPLQLPESCRKFLREKKVRFEETESLNKVIGKLNVLYATRVQKERFDDPKDYNAVKGSYTVNEDLLRRMKQQVIIMHPLPRIDEIALAVDNDTRAAYFRQAKNGLYVRMALLRRALGL